MLTFTEEETIILPMKMKKVCTGLTTFLILTHDIVSTTSMQVPLDIMHTCVQCITHASTLHTIYKYAYNTDMIHVKYNPGYKPFRKSTTY